MRDTEKAFHWIIDILERRQIVYKITGGFAARVYGIDRDLADIDIEVADENILAIVGDVQPFIVFGPARYRDESWDLVLMTLVYEGQEIDIAGSAALIFDRSTEEWRALPGDPSVMKEVFGRMVPVESKASLIAYKKMLDRDVDRQDVQQLTERTNEP